MNAYLDRRLAKLERVCGAKASAPGRAIRVVGPAGIDDGGLTAFLASQGIERQPEDFVIYRAIVSPSGQPAETDMRLS